MDIGQTESLAAGTESASAIIDSRPDSTSVSSAINEVSTLLNSEAGLCEAGARQLAEYFVATYKALGVIPSRKKLFSSASLMNPAGCSWFSIHPSAFG